MNRLILVLVFLGGVVGSALAQSGGDCTNQSANGTYDGGIAVYANVVPTGTISFYSGSISAILATGGTFSGSGWFNYSIPNVGIGNTTNLAGSLVLLSPPTSTVRKYQITLTFSGSDSQGRAFYGTSIQLLTVKQNQSGVFSVADNGGTTTIELM